MVTSPDNKVHGASMGPLGPIGPRQAPCWPHEPCYQGRVMETFVISLVLCEGKHLLDSKDYLIEID